MTSTRNRTNRSATVGNGRRVEGVDSRVGRRGSASELGGNRTAPAAVHSQLLDHWLHRHSDSFSQILSRLSTRERDVLCEFLRHLNDARVARSLQRRPPTIHNQLRAIERALGLGSRTELAVYCLTALIRETHPTVQRNAGKNS